MSHGLQFELAYTFSKSIDNASSFENILKPICDRCNRSLSLFDARHRFVLSYLWSLPVPEYQGAKGKVLNGWQVSGITTFQTGFRFDWSRAMTRSWKTALTSSCLVNRI